MKALLAAVIAGALTFASEAAAETYRLRYEAQVLGVVTLGAASYEVSYGDGRYGARATVRTSGLARLFDQTQISSASAGALTAQGPSWSSYNLSHAYASKFRRIDMRRDASGVSATIAPRFGDFGEVPATPAQQRASHDPVTALFALGRQIAASRACNGRAFVFDGRQHYRLALGGGTRGTFNGGGYSGAALRCSLRYEPIAGYNNIADARRAPLAEAWFGQGGDFAPLLQLTIPTPLGAARLDLRGYEGPGAGG